MNNSQASNRRWLILAFLTLAVAIVIIDTTVFNIAVPYILRDLHTTLSVVQWVISGYALITAMLIITMGRVADTIGRKKVFIIGAILFGTGSFVASLAPNIATLFIGETILEAIGAAMILPSALSLIVANFQDPERPVAMGIWGSVAGAAGAFGPLLGGYLTTYHSWRWSLRINVVVVIIALLGMILVYESKGEGKKKFDRIGTVLSGLGLFGIVFSLIEAKNLGWNSPIIITSLIAGLILLYLFVQNQRARTEKGESVLLNMNMFKISSFSFSLLGTLLLAIAEYGSLFILPIYLQSTRFLSAFQAGSVLLFSSLTILIMGPISGMIAKRIGSRTVACIGMSFAAISLGAIAYALHAHTVIELLEASLVLFGIGQSMAATQCLTLTVSSVSLQYAGEASASTTTMRMFGSSIGVAVLGTLAIAWSSSVGLFAAGIVAVLGLVACLSIVSKSV